MIRCIAVDDEPLALDLIEDNIKKVSFLSLTAKCLSAQQALEVMQQHDIDLMFLDIEMPDISGIQLLRSLNHQPAVILITAYEKYALKSYDFDVVDYLLKPVEFERFLKAANKASEYISYNKAKQQPASGAHGVEHIFVRSEHKIIRISVSDIAYIEGLKDYVKIYTTGPKPILSLNSLKYLEELLPAKDFVRVHRSYIISLKHIDYISRSSVFVCKKNIPVSTLYRDSFFDRIKS